MKKRTQHKLSKLDLLSYALQGARVESSVNYEVMDDDDQAHMDKDIAEIQRRIKLVNIANEKKEGHL